VTKKVRYIAPYILKPNVPLRKNWGRILKYDSAENPQKTVNVTNVIGLIMRIIF